MDDIQYETSHEIDPIVEMASEISLRAFYEYRRIVERAALIPRAMGFRNKRTLTLEEICDIVDASDTSDVPREDVIAFEESGILILATETDGTELYVPAEISYTIRPKHIATVTRNAELVTGWTGLPAHPAVVGVRVSCEAKPAIKSGGVFFYRIRDPYKREWKD